MSCQIAVLGSPAEFASLSEEERFSGISAAAVIPGHAADDGSVFPEAGRFPSLEEAFFAFPSLEAAVIAPSYTADPDEFRDSALLLLTHGKHLFAAVPPALPSGSVRELFDAAREAGCLFYPCLPGLDSNGLRDAKGVLDRRELGEILLAAEEGVIPETSLFEGSSFRDSLKEIILPSLLRLRLLFGEAFSVSALAERSGVSRSEGRTRPDAVILQLRFVSGVFASVIYRPESPVSGARILITGEEDCFTFDPSGRDGPETDGFYTEYRPLGEESSFKEAFTGFLRVLREEEPRDLLPSEALLLPDAARYAEAAAVSALSGGERVLLIGSGK